MTDKTEAMDNLIAQDADLIGVASKVTEADREVLIRISNSDDETAQRIRRGLIYTWEVGEIARHRQQATEAQAAEIERLRQTQTDVLKAAAEYYMSQFGQALEAHGIPYSEDQIEADKNLRAALEQSK